jgi:DNA-directed RNA polymerase specialized sigma24 family protein
MSPLPLRRYRAERLLRREFAGRREEVLAAVRARLRASGVRLDVGDLEACYAAAWQGLYAALLDGREVANPSGWLTVVTFRRAIDEHRARPRTAPSAAIEEARAGGGREQDLPAALDDRAQLRQLFEALRGRLSARECEAASLCYLQGLSRVQAAAQMGIGETAMRKLMEGRGPERPGVAGKVGELLRTIRGGEWCEQQGSLMRGFAFGILDPDGERYRLARLHQRECPACRAYVLSLRGLAAVLPPLALPWGIVGAGAGTGAGAGAGAGTGAGAGASGAGAGGAGGMGTGTGAGTSAGAGLTAAPGAGGGAGTGVGAGAGSGVGAGLGVGGAKLAAGCLLVLGAGCVALTLPHRSSPTAAAQAHGPAVAGHVTRAGAAAAAVPAAPRATARHASAGSSARRARAASAAASTRVPAAERAQREFGVERALPADAATASGGAGVQAPGEAGARVANGAREPAGESRAHTGSSGAAVRAEREFGP